MVAQAQVSIKGFLGIVNRSPMFRPEERAIAAEHLQNVRAMVVRVYGPDGKGGYLTSNKIYKKFREQGEQPEEFWQRFERELSPELRRVFVRGQKSKKEVVQRNLRLAVAACKKYQKYEDFNHLLQEAVVGLSTAVERFNPETGNQLSTYAMWWIRHSVSRCIDRGKGVIRFSPRAAAKMRAIEEVKNQALRTGGNLYSRDVLAEKLGWDVGEVNEILDNQAMRPVASLDADLDGDGELSLLDMIADHVDRSDGRSQEMRDIIDRLFLVAKIKPEEREIIRLIFWENLSILQVADALGMSTAKVKAVRVRAVDRMRKSIKRANLRVSFREIFAD